jgi:hypothetical protein
MNTALEQGRQEEAALRERLQAYERQAQEAEKALREEPGIPAASMFNYKPALEQAGRIIALMQKALSSQRIVAERKEQLQIEVKELKERVEHLEAVNAQEQKRGLEAIGKIMKQHEKTCAELEGYRNFANQPEISPLHTAYLQERREAARKREAEQKAQEREREEQRQRQEKQEREYAQFMQAVERLREQENQKARESSWGRRGMGMGR